MSSPGLDPHRARVEEPMTVATDWLLAFCAGTWGVLLMADGWERNTHGVATVVWGMGFAAAALSALLGGVVHGFQHRMGERFADPLWRTTLHLVALANAGFPAAALLACSMTSLRGLGLALVAIKLGIVTILLARNVRFGVVLADSVLSLAAVSALQGVAWWQAQAASAPWILGGVALAAVGAAAQALRLAPHTRFNHNDLYHVAQIGAFWLLYRGGLLLVAV